MLTKYWYSQSDGLKMKYYGYKLDHASFTKLAWIKLLLKNRCILYCCSFYLQKNNFNIIKMGKVPILHKWTLGSLIFEYGICMSVLWARYLTKTKATDFNGK